MKYQKTLSLILFLLSINIFSFGQVIGFKLGANNSSLSIDASHIDPFDHRTKSINLHFGVSYEYEFNNFISVEPALIYNKRKLLYEDGDPSTTFYYQSDYRLTYLEIPVLAKVYITKLSETKESNRIYILAGPYYSFGLNGTLKIKEKSPINETLQDHDVWEDDEELRLKKSDYGVTYGVGIKYKDLKFEVFHSLGFNDIANGFDNIISAKNRAIGFTVTLGFKTDNNDY